MIRGFLTLLFVLVLATSAISAGPSYALPDPKMTPGVATSVTAAILCAPGYTTKSVRPPASYTDTLKRQQMKLYHRTGTPKNYEEDHLISLEIGGDPRDPKNLWPQPWPEAKVKDRLENALHKAVCAKKMALADAQRCIASDWVTCWVKLSKP